MTNILFLRDLDGNLAFCVIECVQIFFLSQKQLQVETDEIIIVFGLVTSS